MSLDPSAIAVLSGLREHGVRQVQVPRFEARARIPNELTDDS